MPTQILGLLTAVVVAAHLLVLLGTSNALLATQRAPRVDAPPFSTRSIALEPVPPMSVDAAPVTPAALATRVAAAVPAPRPKKASPGRISAANPVINTDITPVDRYNAPATNPAASPPAEPSASTPENVTAEVPSAASSAAAPVANAASAIAPVKVALAQPSVAPSTLPAAAASSVNTAYAVPGSTRLKYNVIATKGSLSFNARAELLWLQDGSSYDARLEVSAFLLGARIQTSTGRLTAQGLEPMRFADKFRAEVAAHFERDKRLVTFSANTPQVPLLAGMQDQLSVVMQLSAMIAGAPAQYPSGTAITFDTIGPRSSEKWVLIVGDEEKLSLPGGEVLALKLTRKPRSDFDQTLELWLAPQLAYLPARIKLTEKDGDYADQVWRATETP